MKTIAKSVAVVVFALVATQAANGQRVMNDPTYSINNYKHPNKAEYMKKQQDAQPIEYVEEIKDADDNKTENSLTSSSNYKHMSASKAKTKKFRRTDEPSFRTSANIPAYSGNYKAQFPGRPRKVQAVKPAQNADVPVANN